MEQYEDKFILNVQPLTEEQKREIINICSEQIKKWGKNSNPTFNGIKQQGKELENSQMKIKFKIFANYTVICKRCILS